jgi:hypothetical protein
MRAPFGAILFSHVSGLTTRRRFIVRSYGENIRVRGLLSPSMRMLPSLDDRCASLRTGWLAVFGDGLEHDVGHAVAIHMRRTGSMRHSRQL